MALNPCVNIEHPRSATSFTTLLNVYYNIECFVRKMSSLRATYQGYLANPNASAFAPDGSLNYITTLTTIHKAEAIAKHLTAHQRVLRKKHENILNTVASENALCLEVETTIEFITGGGSYLPGLDDNFLANQLVTFPVVCCCCFT